MRAAVLGSSSFMGGCLVDRLLTEGYDVLGVGRQHKSNIFKPYINNSRLSNLVNASYDINKDMEFLTRALDWYEPQIIINCIALGMVDTSWDIPGEYFQTNSASLATLVNHLITRKYLKKFLQASTPEVYGDIPDSFSESTVYNPTTPYAASKAAFDMYLDTVRRQYGFPVIMFRSANLYGPHQQLFRIVPITMIKIKRQEELELDGGGNSKRYFIHFNDLTSGVIKLINNGVSGGIYHFAGTEYVSIRELVEKICVLTNYDSNKLIKTVPERRGKDMNYNLCCFKAAGELDWHPTVSLVDGLADTAKWINNIWVEIN